MTKKVFLSLFLLLAGLPWQIQNAQTLTGNWSLVCYADLKTKKQQCISPKDESQTISLEFRDNGREGTLSGHTSSNLVSGKYILSKGNKIKVTNFGGTKVGELDWGDDFWSAIYRSSTYTFHRDTLIILYDNNRKAMKFKQLGGKIKRKPGWRD